MPSGRPSGRLAARPWLLPALGCMVLAWGLSAGCSSPLHLAGADSSAASALFGSGDLSPPRRTASTASDVARDGLQQPDSIRRLYAAESAARPEASSGRVAPAQFVEEDGQWPDAMGPAEPAQPALEMTVDELLQYAVDYHPLLRAKAHEISAAHGALVTAGLWPNPELVLDTDSPIAEGNSASMRLRVMFTIPTAGKRWKREGVVTAAIARARSALGREAESVLLEAADAAVEVLYLQESALLQARLGSLAAERAEIERARFAAGTATFADRRGAEVDAVQAELLRRDTLSRLAAARMRLARAIGMNPPELIEVAGRLEYVPVGDVPLEDVLARARQTRPELAEARSALAESRHAHTLAEAEAVPDISFGPRYRDSLADGDDEMGGRLDFDIPLFDRNQGVRRQTAARTHVSRALLADADLRTLADVAAAHQELLALQSSLEHYESRVLPVVRETEEAIRDEQPGRALSAIQVSSLLRSVIQMRLYHLDLRRRYNRLRTRLAILLGGPVEELPSMMRAAGDQIEAEPWREPLPALPEPRPFFFDANGDLDDLGLPEPPIE
jgi:outer membrane protein, heavy metal efflux system